MGWRLLDFTAAFFVGCLVVIAGFMLVTAFLSKDWGLFGACIFATGFISAFEVILIKDAIGEVLGTRGEPDTP